MCVYVCVCLSENVLCMFMSVCVCVSECVNEGGAVLIGKATCQALEGTFSSYFDTVTLLFSVTWSELSAKQPLRLGHNLLKSFTLTLAPPAVALLHLN